MSHNRHNEEEQGAGISVADIYYVVFRQKWIILAFLTLGLIGAAVLCVIKPARYESEAKVYLQYVTDPKSQSGTEAQLSTAETANSIIVTELDFLGSLDLANQVVANLGAQKILGAYGGGNDTNAAAAVIVRDLVPDPQPKGSVVRVIYQHPDAEVAREVLAGVIAAYVLKSAEMHRPTYDSDEYFQRETEKMRAELAKTEGELKEAKDKAGIVTSLDDWKKDMESSLGGVSRSLLDVQTELAGRQAELGGVPKPATNAAAATNVDLDIPPEVLADYKRTRKLLDQANQEYEHMLMTVPAGSSLLDGPQRKIKSFQDDISKLEKLSPELKTVPIVPSTAAAGQAGSAPVTDIAAEIRRLEAQDKLLTAKLAEINKKRLDVQLAEPRIKELERLAQTQEKSLNGFLDMMVEQRTDGKKKYSAGIKIAESPTPAAKKRSKSFKKLLGMVLGGSVGGGLALAFLIELILDRSVRRPSEIEKKLKLPLFITIPDVNRNGHRKAHALPAANRHLLTNGHSEALVPHANGSADDSGPDEIAPWDRNHSMHKFCSGLRDRLIVNFEVRNLNQNPKLVAVTSCGRGAGVSTIAMGLAASLSETGDGNVLLMNMNGESASAQHFYKGTPGCGLDDTTDGEAKAAGFIHDDLHIHGASAGTNNVPGSLHRHFANLMPKLKASQYDYIVFDMPPVSQTSMTARLSGLMDMVLLVIESEKTSKETVERASALLNESKATVSTVLNKVRNYVPHQLHREVLDGE